MVPREHVGVIDALQLSLALTRASALEQVGGELHGSVMVVVGQLLKTGFSVSVLQVMCWTQVLLLPQPSVAVYVMVRVWLQVPGGLGVSEKEQATFTAPVPQLS